MRSNIDTSVKWVSERKTAFLYPKKKSSHFSRVGVIVGCLWLTMQYSEWAQHKMWLYRVHKHQWIWGVDFTFGIEDTFVISQLSCTYALPSFEFNAHWILIPCCTVPSIAVRFHIQCVRFHRRENQIITSMPNAHVAKENLYSFACFACPLCADTHLINFERGLVCAGVCGNL